MNRKCSVCLTSKDIKEHHKKPLIQGKTYYCCSEECYHVFCAEYAMCEINVRINEIEKRLYDYRARREGKTR